MTITRICDLLNRHDIAQMWAAADRCTHAILPLDITVVDYPDVAHAAIKRHRDRALQLGHTSLVALHLTARIRRLEDDLRVLGFAVVATPEPPDHDTLAWA